MSTSRAEFNAAVIEEFRANAGSVGGRFENTPLLLLHHTGVKSGMSRVNPLAYLPDGGRYVIFASAAGAPEHPAWYRNLMANPRVTIEVGAATLEVLAGEASGAERERLFAAQVARMPQFADYQEATERSIPVIVLSPA